MDKPKNAPISFSPHVLESLKKRGTNEIEIKMAIKGSPWRSAKRGRMEAEMEFNYNNEWNDKLYAFKKVNPVFVVEGHKIIVITVYCFYY